MRLATSRAARASRGRSRSAHAHRHSVAPPAQPLEEAAECHRRGHVAGTRGRLLPELLPAGEELVEPALVRRLVGPAHLVRPEGRLVEVGRVPVERQAAAEVPAPADALVAIPVEHGHDDPLAARLVLVAAVHGTAGVIGIVELDDVIAGDVGRAGELVAQRLVEPELELRATAPVAADAHVLREQAAERVEVAHVEREAVASDQLADLVEGLQPLDARGELRAHFFAASYGVSSGYGLRRGAAPASSSTLHSPSLVMRWPTESGWNRPISPLCT